MPEDFAEFLQGEQESLSDEVFRREYCCEFVSAEGSLFDEAKIRTRLNPFLESLW